MDDKSFRVACQYDKSQLHTVGFSSEDGSFYRESFLAVLFLYTAPHPVL